MNTALRTLSVLSMCLIYSCSSLSAEESRREDFIQNRHRYAESLGHLTNPQAKAEFMRNGGVVNPNAHRINVVINSSSGIIQELPSLPSYADEPVKDKTSSSSSEEHIDAEIREKSEVNVVLNQSGVQIPKQYNFFNFGSGNINIHCKYGKGDK